MPWGGSVPQNNWGRWMNGSRDHFIADVAVKLDRMERRLQEIEQLVLRVETAANDPRNELWGAVNSCKALAVEGRLAAEALRERLSEIDNHGRQIVGLRTELGTRIADVVREYEQTRQELRRVVNEQASLDEHLGKSNHRIAALERKGKVRWAA